MSTATEAPPVRRTVAAPEPPPPPATLEATGLNPDTLSQLLLKSLIAGKRAAPGW